MWVRLKLGCPYRFIIIIPIKMARVGGQPFSDMDISPSQPPDSLFTELDDGTIYRKPDGKNMEFPV